MSDVSDTLRRDLSRDQLVAELRALRPDFERKGVTSMVLFGSRARCDNRPDSDIDLAIEVDPARKFSLLDLIGIEHAIEDHIRLSANVLMRRSLTSDFLDEVRREGMDVF
jgi:predicted nucleotidyltransferase